MTTKKMEKMVKITKVQTDNDEATKTMKRLKPKEPYLKHHSRNAPKDSWAIILS